MYWISTFALQESILNVVFSDHGYCMNPDKAGKPKPVVAQPATVGLPVIVTPEPAADSIPIGGLPTAVALPNGMSALIVVYITLANTVLSNIDF